MNNLFSYKTPNNIATIDKYLLQIHRIKLADYIANGLILPDKYIGDEAEKDVQTKNKDFLVFSDGYIEELDEYQILLEISLTQDEKETLIKEGDIFYLNNALPISRIKKIYAQDKHIIEHIVNNINNSEIGFIQKEIFKPYKKNKQIIFEKRIYQTLSQEITIQDISSKILKYNKRLGMFSFMKNSSIYYANSLNTISNYSEHYFDTLSKLILIEDYQSSGNFQLFELLDSNTEFKQLIYSEKQIDKEFIENIYNSIKDESIKTIFEGLLQPNQTRKTLYALLEHKEYLYYMIGLVYYFRQKDSNKKDNFKQGIKDLIPAKIAEVALAILGIYFGYSKLRASEEFEIKDRLFSKIFGKDFSIKFKLDNKLDYVTIESVYQTSFNKRKLSDFSYLPDIKQKNRYKISLNQKEKIWYEVDESFIYETQYLKIIKKTAQDIVSEKMDKYNDEISFSKDYLSNFLSKHFKNLIHYSKDGKPTEPFAKKDEAKQVLIGIKEDDRKINELLEVFKLDKK